MISHGRTVADNYSRYPTRKFDLKVFAAGHGFLPEPTDNLKWARVDGYYIQIYPKAKERTLLKIVFNKKHTVFSGLRPRTFDEASILFTLLKII